ncbi:MAG: 16S rRNA (cytosine(1402)-N(4))-methyltransferase RsmH [Bdellovibrionales bacterium]|nr:16S rRNA (cytosine(1402)-N(4))-methyltransferase RsmH [Bdellovibrionales bacterium]
MSEPVTASTRHVPVLVREIVEFLGASEGGRFLDCTFGGGGHSRAILEASPLASVVGIDRDPAVEPMAERLQQEFGDRFQFRVGSFGDCCSQFGERSFDGVLADLGMSTDQLHARRGFSLWEDAPLDMRMDPSLSLTADEIVNNYPLGKLVSLLQAGGVNSGEAHHFAKVIVQKRPIATAKKLAEVVENSAPRKLREKSSHPATVIFQALRIAVNEETAQLRDFLESIPSVIKAGGRLAIITFHSLEDRFVAKSMRHWGAGDTSPAWWPTKSRQRSLGKLLTRKAVRALTEEVQQNPASRSAGLRVFEFESE